MTTYAAQLYSIVLPKGWLVMADLKDLAAKLGLENPRTVLATGNLVFEAEGTTAAKLEQTLEAAFAMRFGIGTSRVWNTVQRMVPLLSPSAE